MLQTQRRGCSVSLANIDTARAAHVTLTHTLVHKHNVQAHVQTRKCMLANAYVYIFLFNLMFILNMIDQYGVSV